MSLAVELGAPLAAHSPLCEMVAGCETVNYADRLRDIEIALASYQEGGDNEEEDCLQPFIGRCRLYGCALGGDNDNELAARTLIAALTAIVHGVGGSDGDSALAVTTEDDAQDAYSWMELIADDFIDVECDHMLECLEWAATERRSGECTFAFE
jgi:hypothetical protein